MAGDWIKMEVCLPDKPEVWQMAGMLQIEADSVVGKLLRVWAWFDSHTEDGNAVGVSFPLIDRVAGVVGFAEAMALCGWLEQKGSVLSLPKFGRHNGKTAKNRALTNDRVAKHRAASNASSNVDTVTETVSKTVTREEKRRDSSSARGARLPIDWTPGEDGLKFAAEHGLANGKAQAELAKFRDYWAAQPGTRGVKTDWKATWRNWVRNASTSRGSQQPASDPFAGAM